MPTERLFTRAEVAALLRNIERIAHICRDGWQELWGGWRICAGYGKPVKTVSQDACGVSSFALHDVLVSVGPALGWRVVAGEFRAKNGWHAHAWVEGRINRRRLMVDLTADQFGAEPVIVALSDARYHKVMRDDEVPLWRACAGIHIQLWAGLAIFCHQHGIGARGA